MALNERVLNDVLRVRRVAAGREGGAQQPVAVRVDQFPHGRWIAALRAAISRSSFMRLCATRT